MNLTIFLNIELYPGKKLWDILNIIFSNSNKSKCLWFFNALDASALQNAWAGCDLWSVNLDKEIESLPQTQIFKSLYLCNLMIFQI